MGLDMFGLAGCWYVTVPISYQLVRPKQGDRSAAEVSWNPWIPPRKLPFCMVYPQKPLKTYDIFVGTSSFHRVETTTITASLTGTSNTPRLLWCGSRDAVVGYSRSMSSQCWQETQAELRTILGCYHSSSLPCSHW